MRPFDRRVFPKACLISSAGLLERQIALFMEGRRRTDPRGYASRKILLALSVDCFNRVQRIDDIAGSQGVEKSLPSGSFPSMQHLFQPNLKTIAILRAIGAPDNRPSLQPHFAAQGSQTTVSTSNEPPSESAC